jgi:hypothetical protein
MDRILMAVGSEYNFMDAEADDGCALRLDRVSVASDALNRCAEAGINTEKLSEPIAKVLAEFVRSFGNEKNEALLNKLCAVHFALGRAILERDLKLREDAEAGELWYKACARILRGD